MNINGADFACELLRGLIYCMSPMAQILGLEPLGPHGIGATDRSQNWWSLAAEPRYGAWAS